MSLHHPDDPAPLPPGTCLDDRFEIKELLGAGNFGAVYRASQLVFGCPMRNVALKLFKGDKVTADNVNEVFSDAVTLIGLTETERCPPEIARRLIYIYDIGVVSRPAPQAYISMKLIAGGKTLETAVRRWRGAGGMTVETALRFLRQLLEPLAWMHSLEVPAVHGDLKPDNVLMTDDSDLVLTDFGLAARMPLGSHGGAIQYQAPETLLGGAGGTAADVYALGLIWYEMVTGRHAFRDVADGSTDPDDMAALSRAHHAARKWPMRAAEPGDDPMTPSRIVPPSELNPEIGEHPQLEAMLRKCLSFRESDRYPNARLLLADIERYLENGRIDAIRPPSPNPPADAKLPAKTREALVQDALSLLDGGRVDQALTQAETVLRQHPKFVPAALAVARVQTRKGQFREAQATCAAAQKLEPKNPETLEVLAEVFEAEGKPGIGSTLRGQARQLRSSQAH